MDYEQNSFNFSKENLSNLSEPKTDTVCGNLDARYLTIGDFLEWHIVNCVANAFLCVPSTLMNLLVLRAIWISRTLHSPSYVLLFFLALSDFGVGFLAQPLAIIYTVLKIRGFISMACISGEAMALLATYLCGVSLLSITAVSIDRYLALYLHLRYKQLITNKRVIVLMVCIWLVTVPTVLCWLWYPLLINYVGVAIGVSCIITTTFCFSRIYLILRHHHRQICSQPRTGWNRSEASNDCLNSKRYRRSALGMFMVYILLLLCYIPYLSISCVIVVQGLTTSKRLLFELMRTVLFFNSALNPFIYCWRLRGIRAAVIQRLPCSTGLAVFSPKSILLETTRPVENLS